MSEIERMQAGLAHKPYEPELANLRLRNKELLFAYNIQTSPVDKAEKARLIQQIIGKFGSIPHINSPFHCDYGQYIEVGKNFFANNNCTMLDSGGIKIGDNVMLASNVSLFTVGHPLDAELRNQTWEQALPIVIGNNVWIGGNVVILGGVTIGDNAVIGAGAVVTKDIPANSLAFGNPCRVIRQITAQDRENYQHTYMPFLNV